MTDPFIIRSGFEGLLDKLYLKVDGLLRKKGININEDNGPIINNLWYWVHFLRKFPDYFRYLRKSEKIPSITRLVCNVATSYLPRSSRNIMQEVTEQEMTYNAFNLDDKISKIDDIVDSIGGRFVKVVISACSKGQIFNDDDSAPRNDQDVRICPRRHDADCVYAAEVKADPDEPCLKNSCRVGKIYELTKEMDHVQTKVIFQSYTLMEDGDMSIFNQEKGDFYIIELCPATLRRIEMAARLYPEFKGVVVTFSPGSSCRTLYDRPIRWGGTRDRIITRFAGHDPTAYLLEKLNDRKSALTKGSGSSRGGS